MIMHCGRCQTTEQNTLSIIGARLLLAYFHRALSVQGFLWVMKMYFVDLPSQVYLWECFDYCGDTGVLTRKERPRSHYKSKQAWTLSNKSTGNKLTTKNSSGYVVFSLNGRQYYAHRVIWKMLYGRSQYDQIDHINRNKSDNRLCNLREATSHSNSVNRRKLKTNTSGVTGVCWNNRRQKWNPYIYINTKYKNLGYYDDKREAILVRREAEVEYGFNQWNREHGL